MNILSIVPDDEKPNYIEIIDRLQMGKPLKSFETKRKAKDGHVLDVWLTVTALKNEDGKIYAIAKTERDITQRKKLEEELIASKDQAELYLDLMCHDISNMHQIISGQLEMAKDILDTDCKLEADDKKLIKKSLQTLERSSKLIDNVRKLQNLGSCVIPKEVIDLDELLASVIKEFENYLPQDLLNL